MDGLNSFHRTIRTYRAYSVTSTTAEIVTFSPHFPTSKKPAEKTKQLQCNQPAERMQGDHALNECQSPNNIDACHNNSNDSNDSNDSNNSNNSDACHNSSLKGITAKTWTLRKMMPATPRMIPWSSASRKHFFIRT